MFFMNILELTLRERSLNYVNKFIVEPMDEEYQFSNTEIKHLADIVCVALENVKSNQQLASDFGHYTKDWAMDWHWIAHHINSDYYNIKQSQYIYEHDGPSAVVYKSLTKCHSLDCLRLYLTDYNNIRSEPRNFILSDLISNGSNLDKNISEYKPVIGISDFGFYEYHPYDDPNEEKVIGHYYENSFIFTRYDWSRWDEDKKRYIVIKSPPTKIRKEIEGMIKITITDDDGNIIYPNNLSNKK